MNQFEQGIKSLKERKKNYSFLKTLKLAIKVALKSFVNEMKNYRQNVKSINNSIKFLKKVELSVSNKNSIILFNDFLKESYRIFIYEIKNRYLNFQDEKVKEILESEEYKRLIEYFEGESAFNAYCNVCYKTNFYDFFNLVSINKDELSEEGKIFFNNVEEFIILINKRLSDDMLLTEEKIKADFIRRTVIETVNTK